MTRTPHTQQPLRQGSTSLEKKGCAGGRKRLMGIIIQPPSASVPLLDCLIASSDLVATSVTTYIHVLLLHQKPADNRQTVTRAEAFAWSPARKPKGARSGPPEPQTNPKSCTSITSTPWPIPQKQPHCLATAPPTGAITTPGTEPNRPLSGPHSTHHCSGRTPSDGLRRGISPTSTTLTTTPRSTAAMGT